MRLRKYFLQVPVANWRLLLEFLLAREGSHFLQAKKRKNSTLYVLNNLDADYAFTEIFSASSWTFSNGRPVQRAIFSRLSPSFKRFSAASIALSA